MKDILNFILKILGIKKYATKLKIDIMPQILISQGTLSGKITPVDDKGNTEKVETGSVFYASSDENIFTVDKDPKDESRFILTLCAAGKAQLTAAADADLGTGKKTVYGYADIEVLPELATKLNISFD